VLYSLLYSWQLNGGVMSDNNREIEKKYLVANNDWMSLVTGSQLIYQGYFFHNEERKRIRLLPEEHKAILGFKGEGVMIDGFIEREEIEDEIDYLDGINKIALCSQVIMKSRFFVPFNEFTFEVDQFLNLKSPLACAEVEVKREQIATFNQLVLPAWVGQDVSADREYQNSFLVKHSLNTGSQIASELKESLHKKIKP
jgi:adenylate cyclase